MANPGTPDSVLASRVLDTLQSVCGVPLTQGAIQYHSGCTIPTKRIRGVLDALVAAGRIKRYAATISGSRCEYRAIVYTLAP